MDLLGRIAKPVGLLVVLAVTACLLVEPFLPDDPPLTFNHALHVDGEGLDCSMCHPGTESEEKAGIPGPMACMLCHEDIDAEKPPEEQVSSLFDGEEYIPAGAPPLSSDVRFSHGAHADYGVDCEVCHGDMAVSEAITSASAVTKSACLSCHEQVGRSNACTECHQEIDEHWEPPTHRQQWSQFHGQTVRARDPALQNQCDMCHNESTCQSCHQDQPPQDHTNYFRIRGHGITVRLDRNRCDTCHRSDFCNRCHEETEPISHRGGWGSPLNRHCLSCHEPVQSQGCVTCHRGTPSHGLAPPLPGNPAHQTASEADCRTCHGPPGQPHPDNGDACRSCHQ